MAVQYAGSMSILSGGYEVACLAKSAQFAASCTELDTTALCNTDGWTTCIGGPRMGTVAVDGMADFATLQIDDQMLGSSADFMVAGVPQMMLPAGTADASLAYFAKSLISSYSLDAKHGELVTFSMAGKVSSGPLVRGTVLHPGATARTSSSTGVQQSLGAIGATQSIFAQLQVSGFTAGTLVVKLQSATTADSSFASPTDRITFTTASGVTSEEKSVAGAITDTRWRVSWTIAGGGTWNFTFAAGIATS